MKRPGTKTILTVSASLAIGLLAGIGLGAGGSHTVTKTVTKYVPGPTVTVPGPTVTVTVSPPPPPTGATLLKYSNSGNQVTPEFTVPDPGDYIVKWTYSGNDTDGSSQGDNFIMNEDDGNDSNALGLPNAIGTSGNGSTEVTNDAGTHTFNVQATGNWTVTVISAP